MHAWTPCPSRSSVWTCATLVCSTSYEYDFQPHLIALYQHHAMSSYVRAKAEDAFGPTVFRYANQPSRSLPRCPLPTRVIPRAMSVNDPPAVPLTGASPLSGGTQAVPQSELAEPNGESVPRELPIVQWSPRDASTIKYHRSTR